MVTGGERRCTGILQQTEPFDDGQGQMIRRWPLIFRHLYRWGQVCQGHRVGSGRIVLWDPSENMTHT